MNYSVVVILKEKCKPVMEIVLNCILCMQFQYIYIIERELLSIYKLKKGI
jgi:hypothetical protein